MIIALDTSTPICHFSVYDGQSWHEDSWEAGRTLAQQLLGYLETQLAAHDATLKDITGIVAYEGPGSFTGLRIGLTVLNTIASSESVPIVGTRGESWREDGLSHLQAGKNDGIVMPFYGSDPHITTPRK